MTPAELAQQLTGPTVLETKSLPHNLAAVYVPKALSRYEQAEIRVRLGVRRPSDLEYLARQRRQAQRITTTTKETA